MLKTGRIFQSFSLIGTRPYLFNNDMHDERALRVCNRLTDCNRNSCDFNGRIFAPQNVVSKLKSTEAPGERGFGLLTLFQTPLPSPQLRILITKSKSTSIDHEARLTEWQLTKHTSKLKAEHPSLSRPCPHLLHLSVKSRSKSSRPLSYPIPPASSGARCSHSSIL